VRTGERDYGEIKNSVTCTALWWYAVSYISHIEFPEFHAQNYEILRAIHEAITF
jgi:hypothetical protein